MKKSKAATVDSAGGVQVERKGPRLRPVESVKVVATEAVARAGNIAVVVLVLVQV